MNETQLEIALGLLRHFEATLRDDDTWEVRQLDRDIAGYGRTFAEAVLDLMDKWPGAEPLDED